jgi:two-component system, NtrC family, nitrogen regulation sensor histidine kinase NtrY
VQSPSMAGRLALGIIAISAASAILVASLVTLVSTALALLLAGVFAVAAGAYAAHLLTRPWARSATALRDALASLRDRDFSMSIAATTQDELGEAIVAYNALGERLRSERLNLYQRELLLDTVIQSTPLALVLTNATGAVVYSNVAARDVFSDGRRFEGSAFAPLLAAMPPALQEAVAQKTDCLVTLDWRGEPQVFHVSQRGFLLNAMSHSLLLVKQMTREINSQELTTWKKVIRVIAHELNNSLAPITSLAHSGRLVTRDHERAAELARVFDTIGERAQHLARFVDGYARFAKLPRPQIGSVDWSVFVERVRALVPFQLVGEVPAVAGSFDSAQLEQVLINLLKNSAESGSPPGEINLSVRDSAHGFHIEVLDRGAGFTATALDNALLPFYSTKASGTGLGLTLCREIVEAHRGNLRIANRPDGGAVVSIFLPRPFDA